MKKPVKTPSKTVSKSKTKPPVANIAATPYKQSAEDIEREKEWRARSDIDTLRQAEEIMKDKKRLDAAKAHAKKQVESLNSIAKK